MSSAAEATITTDAALWAEIQRRYLAGEMPAALARAYAAQGIQAAQISYRAW